MKIRDLLAVESIDVLASAANKNEIIRKAIDLMEKSGKIAERAPYEEQVYNREKESTTGVGMGIAIPHGRCAAVKQPGLAAMVIPDGVDYDSLDGQPVNLLFLIAAPEDGNVHLEVLAQLSRMLMNEDLSSALKKAKTPEEFLDLLNEAEEALDKPAEEEPTAVVEERAGDTPSASGANAPYIIAVTGCPTGIAHTYMAAEAIEKKAKEMGYRVKVETRGSGGAKNVLTADDIQKADGIIVAADTKVPMDRFNGKRVIQTAVADGIHKPQELIERSLDPNTPVFESGSTSHAEVSDAKESGWHKVYKDLMNGVSHMRPFIVGGGIMIAIAFLIDGFCVDMNMLAESERQLFGTITPAAAFFKSVGGVAFGFMLPVLSGYIAMSIADRPGLMVGFVGGALAANGRSGFLGALLIGFVAGYVVNGLKKLCSKLPDSLEGIKPMLIYPFCGLLITGAIMMFLVEPPVGWLNTQLNLWLESLNGVSGVVLGALLAGMMAIDMGGPFNKAAYVFGTASLAAGNYAVMASVMIGGMVPPIAIALASWLFKDKFTEDERKTAPTNVVMGLSFITEGAIPFAASDPLRVLPVCAIGSAVAGALSELFGCTLMAPHGGIFVVLTIGNPLMYLVALAAGVVVAALILGFTRKPVKAAA